VGRIFQQAEKIVIQMWVCEQENKKEQIGNGKSRIVHFSAQQHRRNPIGKYSGSVSRLNKVMKVSANSHPVIMAQ
jgi:hypothetical protein